MESRYNRDSIVDMLASLTAREGAQFVVNYQSELQHIEFDTAALLKALKKLHDQKSHPRGDHRKDEILIEHFSIRITADANNLIDVLHLLDKSAIIKLLNKQREQFINVIFSPKNFLTCLEKIGWEKASVILTSMNIDYSSLTKPKAICTFITKAIKLTNRNHEILYKDKEHAFSKQLEAEIKAYNLQTSRDLIQLVQPLLPHLHHVNDFCPVLETLVGDKTANHLFGDCYFEYKKALVTALRHLIGNQQELNAVIQHFHEKNRAEITKAQHEFWNPIAKSLPAASSHPATLFNQNVAPTAPPASDLGIAPEYLTPPQSKSGETTTTKPDQHHNLNPETHEDDWGCRLM